MSPLLEALFTYACENQKEYTRDDKLQYIQDNRIAEQEQEEIKRLLSEEGQLHFADYIKAENRLQLLELESMFHIGLSIGLELSRL